MIEHYAASMRAPVREHTAVTRLRTDDGGFVLSVPDGTIHARQVVVASGVRRLPGRRPGSSRPRTRTSISPRKNPPGQPACRRPSPKPSPSTSGARTSWRSSGRPATNYGWLQAPVLDSLRRPLQQRGVTQVPGLYFLGLHWMHTFKSGLFSGVGRDAEHLAEHTSLVT